MSGQFTVLRPFGSGLDLPPSGPAGQVPRNESGYRIALVPVERDALRRMTAAGWVRRTGYQVSGRIAQLVRAPPLQGGGQGFESLCAHQRCRGALVQDELRRDPMYVIRSITNAKITTNQPKPLIPNGNW